jgi:general secretion pathway protein L
MARRILALDIGPTTLKAAVIESALRSCRVVGFFQHQRNLDQSLAEDMQEFCTLHHLRGDTVLSCVPGSLVTHRVLSLPFTNARQVSQAVPFELEALIPFPLEDLVIAEQIVQRTEAGAMVLAVATPKPVLSEHLAALAAAGVEPNSVSWAPVAALPLLSLSGVDVTGTTALLDIGEQQSSVLLLKDGVACGLRTIDHGYNQKDEEAEEGGEGGGVAFFNALQWTLLALSGDVEHLPTRFFVCGDSAEYALLARGLERNFDAEVLSFTDFVLPAVAENNRPAQSAFATCLGMGLREALAGSLLGINLRSGEFSPRAQDEVLRHEWRRLGRLAAFVALAAGLAVGVNLYALDSRYQLLRREVRRVFTAALPEVQTVVSEKAQLEEAIGGLQQRHRLLHGAGAISPLEVLRQLSTVLPENISLDLEEWVFEEDAVRFRGSTSSFEAAETIKTAVMGLGLFREVQLKDVKTESGTQKVAFGVQMRLKQDNQDPVASEPTALTGTL